MKLTINRILQGEEEVIIRYREMTPQIEAIAGMIQGKGQKLSAVWEGKTFLLLPEEIFYAESVDNVTYVYSGDRVGRVTMTLGELVLLYESRGFFRCSKAMALNIYKIGYLKSEPGNRIRATMENGEQIVISRRYARELRRILKGGAEDAE